MKNPKGRRLRPDVLVAFFAILALVVGLYLRSHKTEPSATTGIGVGLPLQIRDRKWTTSRNTVVVAVRYGCRYCEASMGFYKKLQSLAAVSSGRAQLVFITQDAGLLAKRAVPDDTPDAQIAAETPFPVWIRATPTLLIVGRSGVVQNGWEGVMNDKQQADLLKMLDSNRD